MKFKFKNTKDKNFIKCKKCYKYTNIGFDYFDLWGLRNCVL